MSDEKFQQMLEDKRSSPLYQGLPKYQHIERLGHEGVEGLLDGDTVVQEKIDGANATVAMVDGKLTVSTRNNTISIDGQPATGFNGLVEYVLAHPGIRTLLTGDPTWILRGEWLVRHSTSYSPEAFRHFYVFDVESLGRYMEPREYEHALEFHGIKFVPVLIKGDHFSVEHLVTHSQGPSFLGGADKEGIVIKRYDFVNKWGRTTWGKIVSADFKQKNKLHFGAAAGDPLELRFVADRCTDELVIKTIHKIATLKGETPRVQHMQGVMGTVLHDLLHEELWDFLKTANAWHENRGSFNFGTWRRLTEKKVRDTALGFYNGVPTIHRHSEVEATA